MVGHCLGTCGSYTTQV